MQPHSSYRGNKGLMSDGTEINFPLKNQQAKQMDDDALAIIKQYRYVGAGRRRSSGYSCR